MDRARPPADDAARPGRTLHAETTRDVSTALSSRTALAWAVRDAARAGRPMALLVVGVDRLRLVNEHFGPDVGDAVLAEVAGRLHDAAGRDVRVARLGGDEFGLLVTAEARRTGEVRPHDVVASDVDPHDVEALAARVLQATSQPCRARGRDGAPVEVAVGVSVGVVSWDAERDGSPAAADLLSAADTAMRQAKSRGGGRVAWWSAPTSPADDPSGHLEARLRVALAQSAITLHYQPLVELPSGRVTGVEALARWDDAELGRVPPDRFVAAAERSGLIVELGRQVLRRACHEASRWRAVRAGADLLVSVNVSALQLADPAFVGVLTDALESSGMPPANVCLEITETAAIEDLDVTAERLRELRAVGVSLALDDFGTGYSSLTMLRHLPVDLVKMDRSFVAHLTSDAQDAVLARLIIDAAHAMGMQVCAEGVETSEQARQLSALGCDRAQGWYYARAHPPGDTLDLALTVVRPLHDGAPGVPDVPLTGTDELVLVTEPDGTVVFASSSVVHLLGSTPAQLAGTHVLQHLRPVCPTTPVTAAGGLAEGTARMRATGPDGDRWLEVRTSTVHRHDGRPHQLLSVARDVTAVVRAEEGTAASERRFRHAFDDAPIGMAMTTLDGHFIRVNHAFAQMLGRSPADVLRATVDDLTHEDDRAADDANLDEVRRGQEQVHDVQKSYLHRDGRAVPVRVRAALVAGQDGAAPYILAHVLTSPDGGPTV